MRPYVEFAVQGTSRTGLAMTRLIAASIAGLLVFAACDVEPAYTERPADEVWLGSGDGDSIPPNLKVAFLGGQGDGRAALAVLRLIRDEGAELVLHQGDFDYDDDPTRWDDNITSILGADFPYFASVGNHDKDEFYGSGGYQEKLVQRLDRVAGATCTGDLGVKSACRYRWLFFHPLGGRDAGSRPRGLHPRGAGGGKLDLADLLVAQEPDRVTAG